MNKPSKPTPNQRLGQTLGNSVPAAKPLDIPVQTLGQLLGEQRSTLKAIIEIANDLGAKLPGFIPLPPITDEGQDGLISYATDTNFSLNAVANFLSALNDRI